MINSSHWFEFVLQTIFQLFDKIGAENLYEIINQFVSKVNIYMFIIVFLFILLSLKLINLFSKILDILKQLIPSRASWAVDYSSLKKKHTWMPEAPMHSAQKRTPLLTGV